MATHYADYSQNPVRLHKISLSLANKIVKKYPGHYYVLMYSGLSGISLATALSMALYKKTKVSTGMFYARKETEISHSRTHNGRYEYSISVPSGKPVVYLFVDDFVSTGNTFRYVISTLRECIRYFNSYEIFNPIKDLIIEDNNICVVAGNFSHSNDATIDIGNNKFSVILCGNRAIYFD